MGRNQRRTYSFHIFATAGIRRSHVFEFASRQRRITAINCFRRAGSAHRHGTYGLRRERNLFHNWSWTLSMTFGAILAATDPVAVVALLKSAGASPKLTILIVGESLLNDGTALVLFELFHDMLNGKEFTGGDIGAFAFRAILGSTVLGVAFGLATVRWLRSARRPLKEADNTIQIAVTIGSSYLSFFAAQYSLGMSGLLTCCVAGGVVACLGPPLILNHEALHSVWGMMEWDFNTLIFLLAGLILGYNKFTYLTGVDFGVVLALYVFLMIIRALVIALLYPLISRIGHKSTIADAIFMSWAGLRDALAIALGLIVLRGTNGDEELYKNTEQLFFFCGGIAALTLFINATTAKLLLKQLGLIGHHSIERNLMVESVERNLKAEMNHVVHELSEDYSKEQLIVAKKYMTLYSNEGEEETSKESISSNHSMVMTSNPLQSRNRAATTAEVDATRRTSLFRNTGNFRSGVTKAGFNMEQLQRVNSALRGTNREDNTVVPEYLSYVRTIYLGIVRSQYWEDIEKDRLPRLSYSAQFLLYSIDIALDELDHEQGGRDWTYVSLELDSTKWYYRVLECGESNLWSWASRICSKNLGILETLKEKRTMYILESLISAHETARKKVHSFICDEELGVKVGYSSPEELQVLQESDQVLLAAKKRMASLSPLLVDSIRTRFAAKILLTKQAGLIKKFLHEGLLQPANAEEFLEEIVADQNRLETTLGDWRKEEAFKRGSERSREMLILSRKVKVEEEKKSDSIDNKAE